MWRCRDKRFFINQKISYVGFQSPSPLEKGWGEVKNQIMSTQQKPDTKRGEVAFIFAIVLGLVLGIFIRRIKIGLMIGIALGLVIVFLGMLRSANK